MRNVYIFGASGFIGSEIYKYFNHKNTQKKFKIIKVDKKKFNLLSKNSQEKINKLIDDTSIIIFCSAIKKQLGDTIDNYTKNIIMFNNLLMGIKNKKGLKIIFLSSAAVYGEDIAQNNTTVKSNINIRTFYGSSKYSNEKILEFYSFYNNFKYLILRLPLVFGLGDKSLGYGPTLFFNSALNKKKILIWGDGHEKREFLYVKDVARIIYKLKGFNKNQTLNIVSGQSYSYMDVINIIRKMFKIEISVINRKRSKKKVNHFFNNSDMRKINFKFSSIYKSLNDMIKETKND